MVQKSLTARSALRERRWQGYCESIIRAYKFTSS
ncbi:Protein of unknown function [Escherichia coli]|nr:Protein of unknown function [Escherichia coli]CDU38760.1 Protein of unknown function [Escherichia coli]